MPLDEATRRRMLSLTEYYGSGTYPSGGGADSYFSRSGGIDNPDSYKGFTIFTKSLKSPTDSPALAMLEPSEAKKALIDTLAKGVAFEKDSDDFVSSAYKVVAFLSVWKICALELRLTGLTKLSFRVDFLDGQALDRHFDVVLSPKKNDMGIAYAVSLRPL